MLCHGRMGICNHGGQRPRLTDPKRQNIRCTYVCLDVIEPQILIVARADLDCGLRPYDALLQTSIWFATHSTLG